MIRGLVRAGLVAGMLAAVALFLLLAVMHLRYPVERDYIEGVMLDHAIRIVRGQPLYAPPTLEYVTLAYMPVFSVLTAGLAKVFGPAFWQPRLLSTLATLGLTVLIAFAVRRETKSWALALAGAGVYLGGYGFAGGGHYDLSRPDSLMLCLAFAALTVLRTTTGTRGAVFAAALLVVSFFTKQHAVWFGFAALAHLFVNDRARFRAFAIPWVLGCGLGYLALSLWLGPWFSYYTWNVPSHWSTISWVRIQRYLGIGLLGTIGVLTIPTMLTLALPNPPWRGRGAIWLFAGAGSVCTGLMATLDPSAWHHVFIPTMVGFSILGPISVEALLRAISPNAAPNADRDHALAWGVLLLQLIPLVYSVHGMLPRHHALEARRDFVETLRETPGGVLVICHGFYATLAGKGMGAQIIAVGDLARSFGNRLERRDPRYLDRFADPLRVGSDRPVLFADYPLEKLGAPWDGLGESYRLAEDYGDRFANLAPTSGEKGYPRYRYVPVTAPSDTTVSRR